MSEPAKPYPKAAQLARGERRYRRKVASPKQWQAIIAEKGAPCRLCSVLGNGHVPAALQLHHVVTREDHGDDVADNIVALCGRHHDAVTRRDATASRALLENLSDAEYAYMVARGGPDYPRRGYGVIYSR